MVASTPLQRASIATANPLAVLRITLPDATTSRIEQRDEARRKSPAQRVRPRHDEERLHDRRQLEREQHGEQHDEHDEKADHRAIQRVRPRAQRPRLRMRTACSAGSGTGRRARRCARRRHAAARRPALPRRACAVPLAPFAGGQRVYSHRTSRRRSSARKPRTSSGVAAPSSRAITSRSGAALSQRFGRGARGPGARRVSSVTTGPPVRRRPPHSCCGRAPARRQAARRRRRMRCPNRRRAGWRPAFVGVLRRPTPRTRRPQ